MQTILLTKGKRVVVDDDDYAYLKRKRWYTHTNNGGHYAARTEEKRTVFLHNVIMQPTDNLVVDHINRNSLDCRKENLRLITRGENLRNRTKIRGTSLFYGVAYFTTNKWRAYVTVNSKHLHLGLYPTEKLAALAYNVAVLNLNLNTPLNEV